MGKVDYHWPHGDWSDGSSALRGAQQIPRLCPRSLCGPPNWRLGEDTGKEESKNCSLRALLYCVFCEDEMEGRGLLSEQSLHVLPFVYTKSRARRTSLIIFLSSFYRWGKLGSKISNLPNGHSTKKAINLTWVFPTPELLYFPFLPCL